MSTSQKLPQTKEEWRTVLSPQQFKVLREAHTEAPFSGEYDKTFNEGTYKCVGCSTPLFTSTQKFDSGCGWPAFFDSVTGAVGRRPDGPGRTEIFCNKCNGHLGHVFKGEGFKNPSDERHCVNSVCIKLEK